jgi:hypothetical protein
MSEDGLGQDDELVSVGRVRERCAANYNKGVADGRRIGVKDGFERGYGMGWWEGFVHGVAAAGIVAAVILLALGLALGPARGQESVVIGRHHRVKNRSDHGVCWWASAQMAGNHAGIVPLQGIVGRVVSTGIGFRHGASQEAIDHWMSTLRVKPLTNPEGDRSQAAINKVQGWLDRGLPVIVSYNHSAGAHAVLLTRIGRKKEVWTSDRGEAVDDFPVTYVDPDDCATDTTRSWTWFVSAWTGKAYAFDPGDQDPALVRLPGLRPGRLMLCDGCWHRQPGGLPPSPPAASDASGSASGPRTGPDASYAKPGALKQWSGTKRPTYPAYQPPHKVVPVEVRKPMPPYAPHELPYVIDYPVGATYYRPPSNQDIGDGVTRPDDQFRTYYGLQGHDYYGEFRNGAQKSRVAPYAREREKGR